jgi:DNA-binding NtrC family response regulator
MVPPAAVRDRHVLVVDDESSLRKVLADLLRLRGYDPVAVGSGEEALTLLETQAFAVAIIDMGLQLGGGVMDGLELLRRVRESYPSTECVVLTGAPSQKTAIDAVAAGAFGYLLKPFNLTELVGTLERALAHRRESVELSAAQTRAELIKEANQVIVTRLRRECLASLQNLVRLGQDIVESTSLENAQAYGSLVLAEGQAVLDTINELVASTPSGDGKR